MENIEDRSNLKMNIGALSKIISEKLNVYEDIIKNYIFSSISLCVARNNEMKKEIDKIYMNDKLKYYNIAVNSTCINHIIITQGTLEQEIYARRALGVLLVAESDSGIRSKMLKILRKYYPIIYSSVKRRDKEKLKNKYIKMDIATRNVEARFDAAIYFYFATYISYEMVDQGFIISILNDIEEFEFSSMINQNIEIELEKYKSEIQEIKTLIKREYGQIFSYKDIVRHGKAFIRDSGNYLEDILITNKLNINHIFSDSEFINIDKIILSYVRSSKNETKEILITKVISGIFMQSLINEYKNVRIMYFRNNGEARDHELTSLETKYRYIENENNRLKLKINDLNKEKVLYDKSLYNEINKLNNVHKLELKDMEEKIKYLEKKLDDEKTLRNHIQYLRDDKEKVNSSKNLEDFIQANKIIVIGGDKEWRRKFRIKYPEIRTLDGFNENFDLNILNSSDYIFFYTKYMNHSTFYKAMNFIKFNQCKFGYIGKTNMDLVEQEMIETISKYENISDET
nr:hypothetical protein [Clostridium chromiireducens]